MSVADVISQARPEQELFGQALILSVLLLVVVFSLSAIQVVVVRVGNLITGQDVSVA